MSERKYICIFIVLILVLGILTTALVNYLPFGLGNWGPLYLFGISGVSLLIGMIVTLQVMNDRDRIAECKEMRIIFAMWQDLVHQAIMDSGKESEATRALIWKVIERHNPGKRLYPGIEEVAALYMQEQTRLHTKEGRDE